MVEHALAERQLEQLLERRQQPALAEHLGHIGAHPALDVVQLQPDVGPVARRQEAR